jgi:hypothetical protein
MNTSNSTQVHRRALSLPLTDRLPSWTRGRPGLIVLGTLVLGLGAAFNWGWLVAAGIAPLLLSLLPCVAMCVLGLCMNRIVGSADKGSSAVSDGDPVTGKIDTSRSCCSSEQNAATNAVDR